MLTKKHPRCLLSTQRNAANKKYNKKGRPYGIEGRPFLLQNITKLAKKINSF